MEAPQNRQIRIEKLCDRGWQYAIDGQFDKWLYPTPGSAESAAFAALVRMGYTPEQARSCKWRTVTPID